MVVPTKVQDLVAIASLAGPLILTNLLYVAVATIDLMMLGMLSPLDVAAGGLAIAIFNQLRTMGTGLVTATGNLVSYAKGKQDNQRIRDLFTASLLLSTGVGAVFVLMMLVFKPLLLLFDVDMQLASKTSAYLSVIAIGMLPCLWFQSVRHFSIGLKVPGPLLKITAVSVLLTVVLNYGLIFGRWGLPELGFIGVAVATVTVLFLSFMLFLISVAGHKTLRQYFIWKLWPQNIQSIKDIWKMGLPIAATYGSEAGFFTVLSLLVATFSVVDLAAHTVVNQLVYIVFMISAGISSATSICISEACAEKADYRARRLGYLGLSLGLAAMAVILLLYFIVPNDILQLFFSADNRQQAPVLEVATGLLFIAAFLQFFDASQNIGIGMLRGIGDVNSAFRLSILGYWIIGLPAAWLLGVALDFTIKGVWYGLMIGLSVTAISQLLVYKKHFSVLCQTDT